MPTYHREQAQCKEVAIEGEEGLSEMKHAPLIKPIPFAYHGGKCQCGHARGKHCQCAATCTECTECLGYADDLDNGVDAAPEEEEEREPTLG